jgi:hypothetical protein
MSPLKITRLVGHGSRPAQTFTQSPVTLGTAAGSTIKFDSGWDKGVAARHAVIELTPRGWMLRDLAGTTLCNGALLREPLLLDGTLDLELSAGGVRLRVEAEAIAVAAAPPPPEPARQAEPVRARAEPSLTAVPARHANANSPQQRNLTILIAVLVIIGVGVWWMMQRGKTGPGTTPPPVAIIPPAPTTPAPAPAPAPVPETEPAAPPPPTAPTLPPDVQNVVNMVKQKMSIHTALVEFWRHAQTRSPYAQAAVTFEDFWIAKQLPWLKTFHESGGRTTGQGLDFPGIFVPEAIYPNAEALGVPTLPPEMSGQINNAVAEHAPGSGTAAQVATLSLRLPSRAARSRFPAKTPLMQRLATYAGTGRTLSTGGVTPQAWAVLVGINRFEGEPPPPEQTSNLAGCRNDVAAIGKVLVTQGIFTPERMRLLTDTRKGTPDYPSKANVIAALNDVVQKAGPNDVIFISFSCHGLYSEGRKDSALVMADSSVAGDYLFGSELLTILGQAKAKNVVVSMDACQTGGMGAIGGNQQFSTTRRDVKLGAPIPESFYERLGASRGHVVIRACRADQFTPDIRTYGHGILTAMMVSGLSGDADDNRDGIVTLSELRIYITTAIPKISKRALEIDAQNGMNTEGEQPLEPTFTSSSFGEAGDLPLTVVPITAR